jgi:drug/metabolite transporter (DMT)-like permease
MNEALKARAQIVLAAVLWSTGGAAIKLSHATAPQLASGRAIVCASVLYAFFPGTRKLISRPVLLAAVFYACTCSLFVFSNTLTTAASSIFLQGTAPVWVLLLGRMFLQERATFREKLSVPISLAGGLLFFAGDFGQGRLLGDTLGACAGISYGLLIIYYRKISALEGIASTIAGNVIIALVFIVPALMGPTPDVFDVGVVLYLGTLQQSLSTVLVVRGMRSVSALEGSLLVLFEPTFSPLWAFLFVGEAPGALALLGAGLILAATIWRNVAPRTN